MGPREWNYDRSALNRWKFWGGYTYAGYGNFCKMGILGSLGALVECRCAAGRWENSNRLTRQGWHSSLTDWGLQHCLKMHQILQAGRKEGREQKIPPTVKVEVKELCRPPLSSARIGLTFVLPYTSLHSRWQPLSGKSDAREEGIFEPGRTNLGGK